MTVYTKFKARRDLAQVDPLGFDLTMQSAVFANNATYWQAANNGGNLTTVGGSSPAVIGTSSAIQNASTNFYTSCVRMGNKNTAATAGLGAGFRTAAPQWFLSNTANMGGFFFVCRFGLATTTATNRVFVGLSTTNAALSPTVNPSTFTQMIGFGADSTDTSLQFMSNAALATATKVSLGTNFPSQTAATNFYEVRLFAPSGSASTVYWSAERLNDNVFTSGTATTNLPAANGIMAGHVHYSNGTTATIGQIDLQMLYIESDN